MKLKDLGCEGLDDLQNIENVDELVANGIWLITAKKIYSLKLVLSKQQEEIGKAEVIFLVGNGDKEREEFVVKDNPFSHIYSKAREKRIFRKTTTFSVLDVSNLLRYCYLIEKNLSLTKTMQQNQVKLREALGASACDRVIYCLQTLGENNIHVTNLCFSCLYALAFEQSGNCAR